MTYYDNTIIFSKTQANFSIFSGNYPSIFKHTCEERIALVGSEKETKRFSMNQRVWRDRTVNKKDGTTEFLPKCEACFHDYVYRNCKQIETEMSSNYDTNWFWTDITEKEFSNLKRLTHRKQEKWIYMIFPQTNKSLVIFHNSERLGGREIPYNKTKVYKLIKKTVDGMQDLSRSRKSNGFGRHYKGMRGYGDETKKPNFPYLLVPDNKKEFITFLKQSEINTLQISMLDLMILLDANFITYRVYGKETQTLWKAKRRLSDEIMEEFVACEVDPNEQDFLQSYASFEDDRDDYYYE